MQRVGNSCCSSSSHSYSICMKKLLRKIVSVWSKISVVKNVKIVRQILNCNKMLKVAKTN